LHRATKEEEDACEDSALPKS
jgi:hypothetical protein